MSCLRTRKLYVFLQLNRKLYVFRQWQAYFAIHGKKSGASLLCKDAVQENIWLVSYVLQPIFVEFIFENREKPSIIRRIFH